MTSSKKPGFSSSALTGAFKQVEQNPIWGRIKENLRKQAEESEVPSRTTLKDCPTGLFEFEYKGAKHLGFKSEYKTESKHKSTWQTDAYCLESGEYFWGGATDAQEREELIVAPIDFHKALEESETQKLLNYYAGSNVGYNQGLEDAANKAEVHFMYELAKAIRALKVKT